MIREELLKNIKGRLAATYGNRLQGVVLYGYERARNQALNSSIPRTPRSRTAS